MFDIELVTTRKAAYCGPCCLKMLLEYYGIEADVDELAAELGVRIGGCSGGDMLRVGRARGLVELKAYNEPPAEMLTQDRPGIVWWEYNHFVVVAGMNEKGEAMVCNPTRGRYPLDVETFTNKCAKLEGGQYVIFCNGQPEDA